VNLSGYWCIRLTIVGLIPAHGPQVEEVNSSSNTSLVVWLNNAIEQTSNKIRKVTFFMNIKDLGYY
jgi:hypothetical protein